MTTTPTSIQLAEQYFDAWLGNDVDRLAVVLDLDVTFRGPLAQLAGREDVLAGLRGLVAITEGITVDKRLASDSDVMTWFTLDVVGARGLKVVNWCEVAGGKIVHVHVTFDPRPLLT